MALFQNSVLKKYLQLQDQQKVEQAYKKFISFFQDTAIQQNIRESKEEQFQEGFLRELFVKVLGYTLNPEPDYNLTAEFKNQTGAKKADGAILKDGKALGVIELKSTKTRDLEAVRQQAFDYKANQQSCVYVITSNFEKLRFYINNAVEFEEFDLFNITAERFELLYLCLAKDSLLNNLPLKIKEASILEEDAISKKFYADYSLFKRELYNDIVQRNLKIPDLQGLEENQIKKFLFKKTQKLLDRLLFILFSEDKGLLPPNSISKILEQWLKLKELDEYRSLYSRFIKYFGYLNTGWKGKEYEIYAYNGGLFLQDSILDNLTIDDELLYKQTERLTAYDFESEVDVNILGHIFEHSLAEIENITALLEGREVEKSKTKRKKEGIFYTPKYITKYIVDNTVGRLCEERKVALGMVEEDFNPKRRKETKKNLKGILDKYRKWLLELTILDPACGSGAFLNQALDFLISEHHYIDELYAQLYGSSIVFQDIENQILENNIYGVDINEESVDIARLSLWLRTAQRGRKLTTLNNNIKCGNSLIDDPEVAGDKAFKWEKEFPDVFAKGGFDVVVGNPPYAGRSSYINEIEKEYIRGIFNTYEGKFELYQLFIEQCFQLGNSARSFISLITPQTWLSIVQANKLRKLVLQNSELKNIVFLGKNVFEDASVDTIIFTISVGQKNKAIQYLQTDYLLSETGGFNSIKYSAINTQSFIIPLSNVETHNIVQKIYSDSTSLEKIGLCSDGVKIVGKAKDFAFQERKYDDTFSPMLVGKDIENYIVDWGGLYCCRDKEKIERHNASDIRLREEKMFKRNKILIRKTGSEIVSAIDKSGKYYEQSLFSYGLNDESTFSLEFILAILNSRLADCLLKANAFSKKDTFPQIRLHWLKEFPVKTLSFIEQKPFIEKVGDVIKYTNELHELQIFLTDLLQSKFDIDKLSKNLQNWYELDFKEFLKELKKKKVKLVLEEEVEWMKYFNEQKQKAQQLQAEINKTDKEINQMVYKLYGLTEEEIKIVEGIK